MRERNVLEEEMKDKINFMLNILIFFKMGKFMRNIWKFSLVRIKI